MQSLSRVIADCWTRAEASVQEQILEKHPAPAEENLTFLLSGELRVAVAAASKEKRFERAFLHDLQQRNRSLTHLDLLLYAGLEGCVNFHSRHHEGKTSGADFGLVITRNTTSCWRTSSRAD
jgi:hypothetical protein